MRSLRVRELRVLSRRDFLGLVGVLSAGGALGVRAAPAAPADPPARAGLSRERAATYAALVGAVAAAAGRSSDAAHATTAFSAWYERRSHARPGIDAVLDAVARGERTPFARLSPHARARVLDRWAAGETGTAPVLAAKARALASPPFDPDGAPGARGWG